MQEQIIELVIAGTKMEVFQRELLGKEKGHPLQEEAEITRQQHWVQCNYRA